jgi:monoamine oxidase
VALVFESVFWGENNPHDYIGFLQDDASERGLCYMFCNLYPATKRPILLALMAGEAAEFAEENGDEQVVAVAMSALRRAFPGASSPVQAHVTRWGSDMNTRGCYSFMARDSKVNHHEALAREVDGRVFFAGEHTSRTHPAQVVGAMLSGVLAAGKVEAYARRDGHSFP